jgi:tetratricopeptide (TPR) repeat protein
MKKKASFFLLFFFLLLTLFYYLSIKDNQKKCYGVELNVLTINSFNLNPDIPRISYIGSSFADMTITRLSAIKGINLIERTHLERAKKKLGIKPDALITKEMAVKIGDLLDADLVVIGTIQALTRDSFRAGSQILDLRKEDNKEEEVFISEPVNIEGGIEGIEKSANIESVNKLQGDIAQYITKAVPVALTEEQVATVNKDYTRSGPAYVCYAQGRDFYVKFKSSEDNDTAIEFFKKAIEIDPNYALAHAGLADAMAYKAAYFKTGDKNSLNESLKAARKAISLDPDLPEAYKSLGNTYTFQGIIEYDNDRKDKAEELWDKGIENYKRALEFNKCYVEAYINIGRIYVFKKDRKTALNYFNKAYEIAGATSPEVNFFLGHTCAIEGNCEEAIDKFKTVITLSNDIKTPHSAFVIEAYIYSGLCYAEMNKYDMSLEEIRKAQEINSEYHLIYYALGRIYTKEGEYNKAKEAFEIYLTKKPEGILSKEVRELLEKIKEKIKENN